MPQQKGIIKLLHLKCSIQYKNGVENKVTDVLSKREKGEQHKVEKASLEAITINSLTSLLKFR